jgi:hypothetical protein
MYITPNDYVLLKVHVAAGNKDNIEAASVMNHTMYSINTPNVM